MNAGLLTAVGLAVFCVNLLRCTWHHHFQNAFCSFHTCNKQAYLIKQCKLSISVLCELRTYTNEVKMWSLQLWLRFFGLNLRLLKSQSQLRWSHLHFICRSAVHIILICFIPFTGTMNSINWPAPNVLVLWSNIWNVSYIELRIWNQVSHDWLDWSS